MMYSMEVYTIEKIENLKKQRTHAIKHDDAARTRTCEALMFSLISQGHGYRDNS